MENNKRVYGVNKKSAEEWAHKMLEKYKLTEESEAWKKEFQDYMVYGKPLTNLDKQTVDEIINYGKQKDL